jgi:lysylphosphatidylglycerol synthetase-like protein (DUF2156 family)
MRFAVGIIGILGAAAGLLLGIKWYSDLGSELGQLAAGLAAAAGEAGAELSAMKNATYALLGCGVLGLVVSILAMLRKGQKIVNAVLLIVAGVLPLVFSTQALFGVPMALAGLLAFAINYQKAPQAAPAAPPPPAKP